MEVLGLGCDMQDLRCSTTCDLLLRHSDSLAAACRLSCSLACTILVLWPGMEPVFPALQGRFFTPDQQGSPYMTFKQQRFDLIFIKAYIDRHFITFVCVYGHHSEKAMAPHSSTLAWKIPWTEEHGRLQSMGSLWVRHNWETSLSLFTFMHWRRKWQPTPVFLSGESQGRGSLVGCRLWGHTESDTTEAT